MQLYLVGIEAS
uniref:UORF n=1 Tax=Mus musculus TaxID=10090 RepID=Q7TME3_MOUSE|nr:uORF2 [Mus musculus]AAN17533.1 uORF [Mus musculus]